VSKNVQDIQQKKYLKRCLYDKKIKVLIVNQLLRVSHLIHKKLFCVRAMPGTFDVASSEIEVDFS